MATKLPYRVDCKSTYPFFEPIAAFNCEPAAQGYARDCSATNPDLKYRVRGPKVLTYFGPEEG